MQVVCVYTHKLGTVHEKNSQTNFLTKKGHIEMWVIGLQFFKKALLDVKQMS